MTCDKESCKRCNACIDECPFELFVADKEGFPKLRLAAKKMCIACGHCVAVCPTAALTLPELPVTPQVAPGDCEDVKKDALVSPEDARYLMATRRSIRHYKKKQVPEELLATLLDTASYAPSSHNSQPVQWIVTRDAEATAKLSGMVVDYMEEHGVFPGLVKHWKKGEDKVLRGAPHVAIAVTPDNGLNPCQDASCASAYLELAAHSHGVGACWAGFLMDVANEYAPLREHLGIEEGHTVQAAVMLGYSKFRYRRVPPRKKVSMRWL